MQGVHVPSHIERAYSLQHMAFDDEIKKNTHTQKTIKSVNVSRSFDIKSNLFNKEEAAVVAATPISILNGKRDKLPFLLCFCDSFCVHVLLLSLLLLLLLPVPTMLLLLNRQWAKRNVETKATNARIYMYSKKKKKIKDKGNNNNGETKK